MRLCRYLFFRAPLQHCQRDLTEQRNRIVVQLPPSGGIEVAEQSCWFCIPTPPEIARQCPQAFLSRSDKPVERSGLTDDRRYLR